MSEQPPKSPDSLREKEAAMGIDRRAVLEQALRKLGYVDAELDELLGAALAMIDQWEALGAELDQALADELHFRSANVM